MASWDDELTTCYGCGEAIAEGEPLRVISTSMGIFTFAFDAKGAQVVEPFSVSSKMKWPYRGTFRPHADSSQEIPAVALFYAEDAADLGMREAAGLAFGTMLGAGPQLLVQARDVRPDLDARSPLAVIIEEDAGVSLNAALKGAEIPGVAPTVLDGDPGSDIGRRQTAKLQFDIASQLGRLHHAGYEHGDIKAANVCVRSIGPLPWDLRATIIDFDLFTSQGADIGYLGHTPAYYRALCAGPATPRGFSSRRNLTRVECDLGCLALVLAEVAERKPLSDFSEADMKSALSGPLFAFGEDGELRTGEVDEGMLSSLARQVGLKTLADYRRTESLGERQPVWMHGEDYLDRRHLEELRGTGAHCVIQQEHLIARQVFENYNAHLVRDGQAVRYADFYAQPIELMKSNFDQAASMVGKVNKLGYDLVGIGEGDGREIVSAFSEGEIEQLARWEHERWMSERTREGWICAETEDGRGDAEKKASPHLKPYDELDENMKEYNRQPMREMPALLEGAGFLVVKRVGSEASDLR